MLLFKTCEGSKMSLCKKNCVFFTGLTVTLMNVCMMYLIHITYLHQKKCKPKQLVKYDCVLEKTVGYVDLLKEFLRELRCLNWIFTETLFLDDWCSHDVFLAFYKCHVVNCGFSEKLLTVKLNSTRFIMQTLHIFH